MKTILIIDDSEDTLESLSLVLEDEGYSVVCCSQPDRALQLCREVKFDLVLCDVYMQNVQGEAGSSLGGIDVIWSLSEQFPRLPIITMSGYLEEEQLQKIRRANVVAALSKPFGRTDLVSAVAKSLEGLP